MILTKLRHGIVESDLIQDLNVMCWRKFQRKLDGRAECSDVAMGAGRADLLSGLIPSDVGLMEGGRTRR